MLKITLLIGLLGVAAFASAISGTAAELSLLSSVAFKVPLEELLPIFEKSRGDTVTTTFDSAAALKRKIDNGASFCLAIISAPAIDDLIKRGTVVPQSRIVLAHIGVGVAFRTTDPRPDVGSMDALKTTLLNTRSLSVSDPAAGGLSSTYLESLVAELGVGSQMAAKTILTRPGDGAKPVANGKADIGIVTISEVDGLPGVDAVPLFPSDKRSQAVFASGRSSACKTVETADALVAFLRSPQAAAVFKSQRIDPN